MKMLPASDLSLPGYTARPLDGPARLRFFLRASPRGCAGLTYDDENPTDRERARSFGLDLAAHWTLNAYTMPEPCDGPCPAPPKAYYVRSDFTRESQAFAFGPEGGTFVGDAEVPLTTVLAFVLRTGRELDDGTSRYAPNQRAFQRPGLAALAAEVQAEIWRRGAS